LKYICITNQAGVATKDITIKNLNKINNYIKTYLQKKNVKLLDFFISTDHYSSNSFYRKPNPGNFLKAEEKYNLILDKTFYIGDDVRDVLASYNANTKCCYLGEQKNFNLNKKNIFFDTILPNLNVSIKNKIKSFY